MKLKTNHLLILVTFSAVVFDSLLVPFFPMFFEQVFGIIKPIFTGYYLATMTLIVLIGFPIWGWVSKRVETFSLLMLTQSLSALLGVYCYYINNLYFFLFASFLMYFLKSSFLLIYPLIIKIENTQSHGNTIGILTLILHLGIIFGACIGGFVMEATNPKNIYLLMSAGDILQAILCLYLHTKKTEAAKIISELGNTKDIKISFQPKHLLLLSTIGFLFYFSILLPRPFFVVYWEEVYKGSHSTVLSACAFSLTAITGIGALFYNYYRPNILPPITSIPLYIIYGIIGISLQSNPNIACIISGRILFGFALFQVMILIDHCVFYYNQPENHERYYSVLHLFQGIGTLIAGFSAGIIASEFELRTLFHISTFGLCLTFIFTLILKHSLLDSSQKNPPTFTLNS